MQINMFHQRAGLHSLGEELRKSFSEGKYKSFRSLVAFISWSGLGFIHEEIEKFYDKGNNISIIIGISGEDNSESEVLRYFIERFPEGEFFVFHVPVNYYLFHPKVYIFSNRNETLVIIGSNNLTQGGLFCNSECYVKLLINHNKDKEIKNSIEELWNSYRFSKKPFNSKNLRRVNNKLFDIYQNRRTRKINKRRNTVMDKSLRELFPAIKIPVPKYKFKNNEKKKKYGIVKNRKNLLLEVLKETGAGGTQVQIPIRVIEEFFNTKTSGHQTIQIKFNNNNIRPAVICHFPNNTHRISFPEIVKYKRPFLLKFIDRGNKLFFVRPLKGNDYKELVIKCKNRTRKMAKLWGYIY